MTVLKDYLKALPPPRVFKRALKVSLVVGITLNLINQGSAFWSAEPAKPPRRDTRAQGS